MAFRRSALLLVLAVALPSRAGQLAAQPVQASVARAIAQVYPALVQIQVLSPEHSAGREHRQESAGSGIIISPDGMVVTNHHVAGKAVMLRVTLSSKEELDAELVGTDAFTDIAVLKLDLSSRRPGSPPLPSAHFGASSALKTGDTVLAMGCPFALSQSVTQGIVANKNLIVALAGSAHDARRRRCRCFGQMDWPRRSHRAGQLGRAAGQSRRRGRRHQRIGHWPFGRGHSQRAGARRRRRVDRARQGPARIHWGGAPAALANAERD